MYGFGWNDQNGSKVGPSAGRNGQTEQGSKFGPENVLCHFHPLVDDSYVIVNYTFRMNGGMMSLHYSIHHLMQFLLIFQSGEKLSSDEITSSLNPQNQRRFKKCRNVCLWSMVALIVTFVLFLVFFFLLYSPGEIFLLGYGAPGSQVVQSLIGRILVFVAVNTLTNILFTALVFFPRYLIFVYAMSLLTKQNSLFIEGLVVKCDAIDLSPVTFSRLEGMYLNYRKLVNKLNVSYGKVPLWSLMVLYANTASLGTLIVLSNGKASSLVILGRNIILLLCTLVYFLILIKLCNSSYDSMEYFRQLGLELVNCQMKRNLVKDPMRKCLVNTLKGIPLVKMKAGQTYDIEQSILISLAASVIPMTVMIVTLLRAVN